MNAAMIQAQSSRYAFHVLFKYHMLVDVLNQSDPFVRIDAWPKHITSDL
jgi:hypothetical protein